MTMLFRGRLGLRRGATWGRNRNVESSSARDRIGAGRAGVGERMRMKTRMRMGVSNQHLAP